MYDVKSIANPDSVWSHIKWVMADDSGRLMDKGHFIGVFDKEKMAGAFVIIQWSDICYQIHGGVHPDYWGKGKDIITDLGLALFKTTPCLKIVAIVPEFNRLMIRCLERVGMKKEGSIKKSFKKKFRLHDQLVYGISKSEVISCQLYCQ